MFGLIFFSFSVSIINKIQLKPRECYTGEARFLRRVIKGNLSKVAKRFRRMRMWPNVHQ